jgi:putative hemolysin
MATAQLNTAFAKLFPPSWPEPLVHTAASLLGLNQLSVAYDAVQDARNASTSSFAGRLLTHLRVTCRVADSDLARIPASGPALVVANHPTGLLEGAVLATLLGERRSDVRILANDVLLAVPELRHLVIPLDTLRQGHTANHTGMRHALQHLQRGGLLVVFPAGEVASLHMRGITDAPWQPAAARLIAICARRGVSVPTVPIHIAASNSLAFHAAGLISARLRTALLARELLDKHDSAVDLRIGKPVEATRLMAMANNSQRIAYLRWRVDLLAQRQSFRQQTNRPLLRGRKPVPHADSPAVRNAMDPRLLALDVSQLRPLISGHGLEAYLACATELPHVLQEIGRLRELTFRAAGEGSGRATDLDRFDAHYLHLFLWNPEKRQVAGAYRIGHATNKPADLYTATLFEYGPELLDRLGPALELGRSFIRAEYQRSFAPLLLLWKGIGRYVALHPQYRTLFGPVSISNRYEAVSRDLMISFLEKRELLHGWTGLVRPRQAPPRQKWDQHCLDLDELSAVVADIETDAPGVPVLLRHYLKLGGKLLGFNVDREFAGALDGLIVVDLTRTEPRLLARYLGQAEADAFLHYQKGHHATLHNPGLANTAHP